LVACPKSAFDRRRRPADEARLNAGGQELSKGDHMPRQEADAFDQRVWQLQVEHERRLPQVWEEDVGFARKVMGIHRRLECWEQRQQYAAQQVGRDDRQLVLAVNLLGEQRLAAARSAAKEVDHWALQLTTQRPPTSIPSRGGAT